jgi:hypothetical protein
MLKLMYTHTGVIWQCTGFAPARKKRKGMGIYHGYTIRKGKTMGEKKKIATACQRNGTQRTLNSLQQDRFQVLKSGLSAFLVPTLVSAEEWQGCMGREADSFLRLLACSKARVPKINPDTYSLRTLSIFCHAMGEEILPPFSLSYGRQGMAVNGVLSIPKTLVCHNTGSGSTLLDILEGEVDEGYFLSEGQTLRLLEEIQRGRGKDSPAVLLSLT